MTEKINSRQYQILKLLLENKAGLSIDELARCLDISRAAVQQHFVVLERDGLIKKKQLNKTGGRPVSLYELTDNGINYFPKQYAWLTDIILSNLLADSDRENLIATMRKLGSTTAESLQKRLAGKVMEERINELSIIMNELGYQVKTQVDTETDKPMLQAFNCVYHDLTRKRAEICDFDVAFMSALLDKPVKQASCMAKGDCSCRFIVDG
ncbi:MAG: HTH domain-containing protein [Gammaproteobacteria bacterium]|nr:HTH domain-containing protein [Gammaproteobacteria bacterium]